MWQTSRGVSKGSLPKERSINRGNRTVQLVGHFETQQNGLQKWFSILTLPLPCPNVYRSQWKKSLSHFTCSQGPFEIFEKNRIPLDKKYIESKQMENSRKVIASVFFRVKEVTWHHGSWLAQTQTRIQCELAFYTDRHLIQQNSQLKQASMFFASNRCWVRLVWPWRSSCGSSAAFSRACGTWSGSVSSTPSSYGTAFSSTHWPWTSSTTPSSHPACCRTPASAVSCWWNSDLREP